MNPMHKSLFFALAELGQREITGPVDNPRIVDYWDAAKIALEVNDDETPWCAAFVGYALESAGLKSSRSGLAKSYRNWGQPIALPMFGAIAVLNRANDPLGKSSSGHTGFVVGWDKDTIRLLGGNQGNRVSIADFPRSRLIREGALRWAIDVPFDATQINLPVSIGANPGDR